MVPLGPAGAAYPAGAQEGRHLRFPPSCESPLFPWRVWRRLPTCDRCENGERQSGYRCVSFSTFSQFTDSVLLHRRFTLRRARHSSAAQLVSLEFTDGTYESIYLVAFILVGPVYHNALTDCAALSCRACVDLITCVAERYLTLRIGCSRGRTPKVVRP